MKDLNKADFYYGAFYSYLFNKTFNPVLIDGGENSRHLSVCTNTKEYNLFAMYISKPSNNSINKVKSRWDFTFTENLIDLLIKCECSNKENYVVFICGQENMKDSEIIVVPYVKVLECLGNDKVNENRRISITVSKHETYAYYYGTAVSSENKYRIKRNIEEYLN